MNEQQTVLSKLCYTNWGNSKDPHVSLDFSKVSNILSGETGSGKSTVIDALQVLLYGSGSSRNFNIGKKTTSNEEKRTALSYLRGHRKNFEPIRENVDFYANIVGEFHDLEADEYYCAGVVFKVPITETNSIPEHNYFIVNGTMPEDEFANCTFNGLESLVNERIELYKDKSPLICKVYPTDNVYINALMDGVFGGIDYDSFANLQRAAITTGLSNKNSSEDFIKAYLFVDDEKVKCDSLIRAAENNDIMKRQCEYKRGVLESLNFICEKIKAAEEVEKEILEYDKVTENIKYKICSAKINDNVQRIDSLRAEIESLKNKISLSKKLQEELDDNIARLKATLENNECKQKEIRLEDLREKLEYVEENVHEWETFLENMREIVEDDDLPLSPQAVNLYESLTENKISLDKIESLMNMLHNCQELVEGEWNDVLSEKKEQDKLKKQLELELSDLRDDNYKYRNNKIQPVRRELQRRLSLAFNQSVDVEIFSRTFEIVDEEWRNAIEGYMKSTKSFLIVEPRFYKRAIREFKNMETYGIRLIDSLKMVEDVTSVVDGSLYECVNTDRTYVDAVLKYYLGRVKKCNDVSDFDDKKLTSGVTKDCYAYYQRSSSHLNKIDYTDYASIGLKVDEKIIARKEIELKEANETLEELKQESSRLNSARTLIFSVVCRKTDELYRKSQEINKKNELIKEINSLIKDIELLRNEDYQKLKVLLKDTQDQKLNECNNYEELCRSQFACENKVTYLMSEKNNLDEIISHLSLTDDEDINAKADNWIENIYKKSFDMSTIDNRRFEEREESLNADFRQKKEALITLKNAFVSKNPLYGLDNSWNMNSCFLALRDEIDKEYNEEDLVDLKEKHKASVNAIYEYVYNQLHSTIKNARASCRMINEQFKKYKFGNNIYEIRIERSKDTYGRYYDWLTSKDWDLKMKSSGMDGQMDLGDTLLKTTYADENSSFAALFTPPNRDDFNDDKEYEIAQRKFKDEVDKLSDYRTYLHFEYVCYAIDAEGNMTKAIPVDSTAGIDSGGEEVCPKYLILLMAFKILYKSINNRKSKLSIVLMDESFQKLDIARTHKLISYAKTLGLQLIIASPDKDSLSFYREISNCIFFKKDEYEISTIQQMLKIDKEEDCENNEQEIA